MCNDRQYHASTDNLSKNANVNDISSTINDDIEYLSEISNCEHEENEYKQCGLTKMFTYKIFD